MNLLFLLKTLQSRIWLLVGAALFAAVLTFLLTLDYERTYLSSARLSTGFTLSNPINGEAYSVAEERVKFNNLMSTLNSPVMISMLSYNLILNDLSDLPPFRVIEDEEAAQVVAALDLDEAREIFRKKLENFEVLTTFDDKERALLELLIIYDYDVESVKDQLTAYREGQTDYITVRYLSENPQLSAFAVNTLCQEFIRYYNSLQSARTTESVETYQRLVAQKQQALEAKADLLEQFKSSQGVLNFNVESESKVGQIAQAEAALNEERKNANALRLSLEGVNNRMQKIEASAGTRALTNSGANAELLAVQEQIEELNQKYVLAGLANPTLLDSLNQLRSRRTQLLSTTNRRLPPAEQQERLYELETRKAQLETELAISRENLGYIQSSLGMLRNNASTYASKEARIAALQQEVALATQEYQDAQEKYNQALDMSLSSASQIRQVLYGQPAIEPEPSQRLILTALAGLSTFVLGALIIGFLGYIDVSLKDPASFARRVGTHLIGTVNYINFKNSSLSRIFSSIVSVKDRGTHEDSIFKELLRKIRFEIERTNQKTFLFTSTKPQEGKSILIIALAHTFSLSKKRVLIIDTNFPHHTLTKYFKASPSLEDFVTGKRFTSEESKAYVTQTGIPSVDIIGCTGGNYSPLEIFSSEDLEALINHLSQSYDYILMEGPSINKFSDTKELALFADKVIAVFSAKSVLRQADHESVDFLQGLGDKFMGSVLTQVEKENAEA